MAAPTLPRRLALASLFLLCALPCAGRAQSRPLMLATAWRRGMDLEGYWVSEKLDGMRGYWDGQQLWSRGGHRIQAPPWFTQGWPAIALDGELWCGRGRFEQTLSTVRSREPRELPWREVQYMAFDLPSHPGTFSQRHPALDLALQQAGVPWLRAVAQERPGSAVELQARLRQVTAHGGEGLMLHHGLAHYKEGRQAQLLKLKPQDDAEGVVVAHLPGSGAQAHALGALLLEWDAGDGGPPRRFRLASGLSQSQRQAPPPLGSVVSFRFQGLTASGLPRFASFWRLRPPE